MASSSTSDSMLRLRFGQILMSNPSQAIDFRWGPLHVNGSAFSFIALALASVPPKGMGCLVTRLPPNTGAQYDPDANRIEVPLANFGLTAWEKMSVVHEATHAIADATMKTSTRGELEETAAYVAGALFNIYSAPNMNPPYPFNPVGGGLFETAHNVAMQIAGFPGGTLDPNVASPLRLAILADPTYAFLRSDPRYSHDGVKL